MKLVSPAQRGKRVQMQMSGDACARGLAQIQSKVVAVGMISAVENPLRALRQLNQFMRGLSGQRGEPVEVRIGHHHHVARRVGIRVEADKAIFPAQNQPARGLCFVPVMPLAMAKSIEAIRLQKTQPRSPGHAASFAGTPGRVAVSVDVT